LRLSNPHGLNSTHHSPAAAILHHPSPAGHRHFVGLVHSTVGRAP
jgi:hypothetical protein